MLCMTVYWIKILIGRNTTGIYHLELSYNKFLFIKVQLIIKKIIVIDDTLLHNVYLRQNGMHT